MRRSMLGGRPNPLGFHQDGFFSAPGFNFWTPLAAAGRDRPGLEVVIGSGGPILAHEVIRDAEATAELITTRSAGRLWHPEVKAGDALVFTTFMLHRTYVVPGMDPVRYSLELRGDITEQIPIAGVRAADWSAPRETSLESLRA